MMVLWLVLGAAAALAVFASFSRWRVTRARADLNALSEGLLSFKERDYAVRMLPGSSGPARAIAHRFNALGEQLRVLHSERYQRELLLEAVLEATPSAVLLIDAAETVVYANVAARDLFFDAAPMEGHSLTEIIDRAPEGLREALRSGDDGLFTAEQGPDPDGHDGTDTFHVSQRTLELSCQPHRLVLIKPLTRELVRKEADAWKRAIRVMSHEITNSLAPVSSLVNTARRILERPDPTPRLATVFDTIADRTSHLQTFLDGYAQFARLPRPAPESVDWRTFLDRARALYDFIPPVDLPLEPGHFDPAQMQQVLLNLLKNAVESGSPPAAIFVRVTSTQGGTLLEVADGGAGMDDHVLKQVLVPFYSTKKSGSGIGLPLCREIVETHGGSLSIASAPGQGTVVRCLLPSHSAIHRQH